MKRHIYVERGMKEYESVSDARKGIGNYFRNRQEAAPVIDTGFRRRFTMPSKKMICSRVEDGRINKENFAATGHPLALALCPVLKHLPERPLKIWFKDCGLIVYRVITRRNDADRDISKKRSENGVHLRRPKGCLNAARKR